MSRAKASLSPRLTTAESGGVQGKPRKSGKGSRRARFWGFLGSAPKNRSQNFPPTTPPTTRPRVRSGGEHWDCDLTTDVDTGAW
jgi:hypothetical protein